MMDTNMMINSIDIRKRTIGVNFTDDQKAVIWLWAPLAEQVAIAVCGLDTPITLENEEFGYWTTTTDRLRPGDQYNIVLNGDTLRPDPASLAQPESVHGPSQAVDLRDVTWTDDDWENPSLDKYILYELHTGTFTAEGTFAALDTKLAYLKDLGINAIELMPVAQFPGSRNWGYDGVLPFAVQNSYGGVRGLQHLVDVCHQKGIAVVAGCGLQSHGARRQLFPGFCSLFHPRPLHPLGRRH